MKPLLLSLTLLLSCKCLTAQIKLQKEEGKPIMILHNAPAYKIIDTAAKYFNYQVVYRFNKERINDPWAGTMPLQSVDKVMTGIAYAQDGLCYTIKNNKLIVELVEN